MASKDFTSAASHVSFRLTNPAHAVELAARAEARRASANLVARELVIDALIRSDDTAHTLSEVRRKLDELIARQEQLRTLQRTVFRGVRMLLVHGGKLDAAQATEMAAKLLQDEASQ